MLLISRYQLVKLNVTKVLIIWNRYLAIPQFSISVYRVAMCVITKRQISNHTIVYNYVILRDLIKVKKIVSVYNIFSKRI